MLLVIEDNEIQRRRLTRRLALSGFLSHAVSHGPEVVDCLSRGIYRLVLLDVSTPGLKGLKTTKQIRESQQAGLTPPVPIIAMTSLVDRELIMQAGVSDCIDDPIVVEQVTAAIERWLSPGTSSSAFEHLVPNLGRAIKDLRLRRGLTASELSRISGVAEEKIVLIESGKDEILSVVTLIKLAEGLCIPVSELVEVAEREIALD